MPTITVGGEQMRLLPQKAALLPASGTLLVADAHFGKALSFRALGVPVPHGTTGETLGLLGGLVALWSVRRLVFLGDFLHSARGRAPATLGALERWRENHRGLDITLVRGNHDHHAGDPPAHLGIEVVDEPLQVGGLLLCHHPLPRAGGYVLGGHLHPCVSVSGRAHDRLRLPCFWFGADVGVLPAFGAFTGMHAIRPEAGDRLYAVADDHVAEVRRAA